MKKIAQRNPTPENKAQMGNSIHNGRRLKRPLTKEEERSMAIDGAITSAVIHTGATSTAGRA